MCVGWLIKNFSQFNVIYYLLIIHVLILWLIYLLLLLRNNNLLCLLIRHVHHYIILCLHYILIHYSLRKQCGKLMLKFISRQDEKKKSIKNLLADSRSFEAVDNFASLFVMRSSVLFVYSELFVVVELLDFAAEILSLLMILQLLATDTNKKKYIIPLNDLHENYMSMYVREANVERGSDVN